MKKLIACSGLIAFCIMIASFGSKTQFFMESPVAREANRYMWNQLHLGNYDSIPAVLEKLNHAYLLDPKDMKATAHLGFMHLWAFSERGRKLANDSVAAHIPLSNRFFKEAIVLNPNDPRLKGFHAATEMCKGALEKNPVLLLNGYSKGKKAISEWTQFNKFALSFIESLQDKNSRLFKEGIRYQWEVIDECSCKKLTTKRILASPDSVLKNLVLELSKTNDAKIKRACWSSWIAPHNLEGFFLNFGDMLVKDGKLEEAKIMYGGAKLAPTYKEWPFKKMLEERIKHVNENELYFNQPIELNNVYGTTQVFINSEASCTGCHQMSKAEFAKYGYQEPGDDIYFSSR